ncbi:hypothetical protein JOB18_035349 [Solea senegalensis]|uniref:Uncharacterized protein n=1 Tax=Solea senegalensis TaxID=28829 RepID=A0AAV6QPM5_SOLSE|nr:hypothetical protein JOB18_035349 [Solea senegalensis]
MYACENDGPERIRGNGNKLPPPLFPGLSFTPPLLQPFYRGLSAQRRVEDAETAALKGIQTWLTRCKIPWLAGHWHSPMKRGGLFTLGLESHQQGTVSF